MREPDAKQRRGRPPQGEEAMDGFVRQRRYVRSRQKAAAEIARALKQALSGKAARAEFKNTYGNGNTVDGQLIRRGLTQVLVDDPATLAFFEKLFRQ